MSALWLPVTVLATWLLAGEVLGRRRAAADGRGGRARAGADVHVHLGVREPRRDDVRDLDARAVARRPLRQTRRAARATAAAFFALVGLACTVKTTSYALLSRPPSCSSLGLAARWPWRIGARAAAGRRRRGAGGAHARRVGARRRSQAADRAGGRAALAAQVTVRARGRRRTGASWLLLPVAVLPAAAARPAEYQLPLRRLSAAAGLDHPGLGGVRLARGQVPAVGVPGPRRPDVGVFAGGAGGARARRAADSTCACSASSRSRASRSSAACTGPTTTSSRRAPRGFMQGALRVPGHRRHRRSRSRAPCRCCRRGGGAPATGAAVAGAAGLPPVLARPGAGAVLCVASLAVLARAGSSRSSRCRLTQRSSLVYSLGVKPGAGRGRARPRRARLPGAGAAAARRRLRPRRLHAHARSGGPTPPVRVEVREADGGRALATGRLERWLPAFDPAHPREEVVEVGRVQTDEPLRALPGRRRRRHGRSVIGQAGIASPTHLGDARRQADRRRPDVRPAQRRPVAGRAAAGHRRPRVAVPRRLGVAAGLPRARAGDPGRRAVRCWPAAWRARTPRISAARRAPAANRPAARRAAARERPARPRNGESRSGVSHAANSAAETVARRPAPRAARAAGAAARAASRPSRRASAAASRPPPRRRAARPRSPAAPARAASSSGAGIAAHDRRPAVALQQPPLGRPLRELVVVVDDRRRLDAEAPAGQPQPQREVDVLLVHEERLGEPARALPRAPRDRQAGAGQERRPSRGAAPGRRPRPPRRCR